MNKHIKENLDNYIGIENPEYAVLLSGKWGSGKTYFINNYVENFKNDDKIKFIKISLFGLSKVTQIDEIIFQKLHPVLGHKYAKMTGSMLKSALKLGLNFDFDGDGKSDGRLTIDPKEFSFFSDDKKSKKELIFIFDDLERASIELSEILGYINYLVEQSQFKVIILANENEINDKDNFNKFKEKIIGKTFEVQQDLDSTFSSFINIVDNSKDILSKHKELIKEIFTKAEYNNLRHIRQTILDFEYFYNQLDDKFKNHDKILYDLIYEFFSLSIEIKAGNLTKDIFKFDDELYINALDDSSFKSEESQLLRILNKYSLEPFNLVLSDILWKDILLNGIIDKEAIAEKLNYSKYLIDEQNESWRKLWHYRDLEDNEFKEYLEDVSTKFYNNEYKKQGKLLHVIALLLYFSRSKMYKKTQRDIMNKAKENIKNCIENENWYKREYDRRFGSAYTYNLGIFDGKSKNAQKILDFFEKEIEKYYNKTLKNKAEALLNNIKNNEFKVIEQNIVHDFYGKPIFNYIDIYGFIYSLQQLKNKDIYSIGSILKKRYENIGNLENILSEERFWKSINNRMLKGINVDDSPVKYNVLKSFKEYTIKEILENFKRAKKHYKELSLQKNTK